MASFWKVLITQSITEMYLSIEFCSVNVKENTRESDMILKTMCLFPVSEIRKKFVFQFAKTGSQPLVMSQRALKPFLP